MGVFSALTTAVTGLQAQSYALENISGNIANSRTAGFKRVDTSFAELVPTTSQHQAVAGSVLASSRATNTLQGDFSATRIATNAAIDGDGFFVVDAAGTGTGTAFAGSNLYTRRGDFDFDANGYLVNGSGYYLKGLKIDAATGQPVSAAPEVLQLGDTQFPAKGTSSISYRANIPATPATSDASSTTPGSELLDPADYGSNPTTTGTNTVVGSDLTTFLRQSIPGGNVTVYDELGQATSVEMRWAKISNAASGPPAVADTWNLFIAENTAATGAATAYRNVGAPVTFGPSGQLTSAATIALPTMTIAGTAISGLTLDTGSGGLTQNGDTSGQVSTRTLRQDGYAAGALDSVSIDESGQIVGSFSNGQTRALAQVAVARFNSANNLKRLDGGAFAETLESGSPLLGLGTSAVAGGQVEQSNTDIADEFSKMIVTQQAYSANTKVITTAQDMLRDAFNIVR